MSDVQRETAKLHHELERLEKIAYDTYCDLEVATDALKQILEKPEKSAEIAKWALSIVEENPEKPAHIDNV